jgi:hypothetical protein
LSRKFLNQGVGWLPQFHPRQLQQFLEWIIGNERNSEYLFEVVIETMKLINCDAFRLKLLKIFLRYAVNMGSSGGINTQIALAFIDNSHFIATSQILDELFESLADHRILFWRCFARLIQWRRIQEAEHDGVKFLIAQQHLCQVAVDCAMTLYENGHNKLLLQRIVEAVMNGKNSSVSLSVFLRNEARRIVPVSEDIFPEDVLRIVRECQNDLCLEALELILSVLIVREGHHIIEAFPQHHSEFWSHVRR